MAAGHVTTCDTTFSIELESTNNFCRFQRKRNAISINQAEPHTGKNTFEIHQTYSSLQTSGLTHTRVVDGMCSPS